MLSERPAELDLCDPYLPFDRSPNSPNSIATHHDHVTPSICVFLDSREQALPPDHAFYRIVEEILQNTVQSPLVLRCMANHTFIGEPCPESPEAAEKQRVEEIIQYLENSFPTVSGSDSPAMDSTIVDVRAYSGCGKDLQSRKFARMHVVIQKPLVDALMKAQARSLKSNKENDPSVEGHFYLLTFLVKLCLLRGLITVIKLAFTSGDIDMKDPTHRSLGSTRRFQSLFERFLWEWDGWFIFLNNHRIDVKKPRYGPRRLWAIVLPDRVSEFCYVLISSDMSRGSSAAEYARTLPLLAAGDWTALPTVIDSPFNVFQDRSLRIWNSPPTGNPTPRRIEMTLWNSDKDLSSFTAWFNRVQDPAEE